MALLAKLLHDFSSDKSSAANDDDFHVVLLILMVARCEILGVHVATPNENKMSDGGRGRAWLVVEVISNAERTAIRRALHRMVRPFRAIKPKRAQDN